MSNLPEGWVHSTLAELGMPRSNTIDPRKFPNESFELFSIPSYETGRPEILKGCDIGSTKQQVLPGDILLSKIVPHLVRVWIVPNTNALRQIASGEWIVIRQPSCSPHFLRRLLMEPAFREEFMRTVSGVGGSLLRARPKEVALIDIPLAPRSEQDRISIMLESLYARTSRAREELSRIPLLIEHYKQAILSAAFRGELTAEWRAEKQLPNPEPVELGDVAEGFAYGTSSKSSPVGDIPVIRMGNIQEMAIDWEGLVFTSDANEIEKYALREGDVLFNRTNSPELVGKTAIYLGERPAIYAGYIIRVRCGERLLPDYLNFCLNSPLGRDYCWSVKTDGVSQSNINAKKLARFSFLLPSMDEQTEIVARIRTTLDWLKVVANERDRAAHLIDHLDQAHLAKAFRGELVPQDPNDEPASILLERIRQERQAQAPKRRAPRKRAAGRA